MVSVKSLKLLKPNGVHQKITRRLYAFARQHQFSAQRTKNFLNKKNSIGQLFPGTLFLHAPFFQKDFQFL